MCVYRINSAESIFLLYLCRRWRRGCFAIGSSPQKSDICRWCAFTHSLCNPNSSILLLLSPREISLLLFFRVPPIFFFCARLSHDNHFYSNIHSGFTKFFDLFFSYSDFIEVSHLIYHYIQKHLSNLIRD